MHAPELVRPHRTATRGGMHRSSITSELAKEHVDGPSGLLARRAQWHETFRKFDLSLVYVPGKDKTVADCLSRRAKPAGKAWMSISSHGDAEETEEAKGIIELEKGMEEGDTKCFVLMASKAELSQRRDA